METKNCQEKLQMPNLFTKKIYRGRKKFGMSQNARKTLGISKQFLEKILNAKKN